MPKDQPRCENAPGLAWKSRRVGWEARWQCRSDLVKRGYQIKSRGLWTGIEPTELEKAHIAEQCRMLQDEMLEWSRGGIPILGQFDGTLRMLINCYQTDADSTYKKLRFRTRQNQDTITRRIESAKGAVALSDINARALIAWHKEWSADGAKVTMGHSFIARLRTLFSFGATILEDRECERLCGVLHKMRFPVSKPRTERMTADQAIAVRTWAHKMGLHSIALAQALQFELMLRQKDVIGEWVPTKEAGTTDVVWAAWDLKWLRGLRWSEIDDNMILRHDTSKKNKLIEVNLKLAAMVMEEFARIGELPKSGPMVVSEFSAYPWSAIEFRRQWRKVATAAGVPKEVYNMDSRAGGITEATDAGADLEHVRHAATHSNISMTQKYSRGSVEKVAQVMEIRAAHRNKK